MRRRPRKNWTGDEGVEGSYRFLNRVWRLIREFKEKVDNSDGAINIKSVNDKKLNSKLNATIKKVTDDIEKRFNFNTAISSIMELVNELYKYTELVSRYRRKLSMALN